MATETIELNSALDPMRQVSVEVEVPDRLANGRGEVIEAEHGGDQLRIRLTDEELTKLPAGTPREVMADRYATEIYLGKDRVKTRVVESQHLLPGGVPIRFRLEGRPELQALLDNVMARQKAQDAARQAYWTAERQAEHDRIIARVREIQETLPAGRVVAYFTGVDSRGGEWDERAMYLTLDGRPVAYDARLGMEPASEERTGAYQYITYASVPVEAIERQREADRAELEEKNREAVAAWQAREDRKAALLAVEVPAEAVAAYESCGGDPDRLPEDIDHPHYWLVKRYAGAIEAQGLAIPTGLTHRIDEILPEGA